MFRRIIAMLVVLAVGVFYMGIMPEVQGAVDYSIVRVRLSSMGSPKSVKVEVKGNYSIPENKDIYLEKKAYEIGIKDGKLILKDGNTVHTLGTKFTFKQHKGPDSDCLMIQNPSYGKQLNYKGDMVVSLEGGAIRLTNHVYLETYLYGVVPSEMPNSWNFEALKAQAVAARTYAVRCKKTSSNSDYDVVDTQSSQVYKGFSSSWGNSIKAVNETAKKVLKYDGGFTYTFYSSSNGGWIEAGYEVFSSVSEKYKPLLAKKDPHDPVHAWSITLYKTQIDINGKDLAKPDSWWDSVSERNYGNYKSLINTLKDELKNKTKAADVKIVSIDQIKFTEKTAGQRYNEASFTLSFYAKDSKGFVMDEEGNIKLNTEIVTVSTKNMRSCIGLSVMRSYYINEPKLEKDGQTGVEYYVISGQGYGHGVGMSQYGAKAMAEKGFKYTDILNFYYPESTIEVLNISPPDLTDMPSRSDDSPDDDPEPPSSGGDDEPSPVYGKVKVKTSLNVRQGPGTQYKRMGSLAPNVRVQVLGQEGEWYKIKAGNLQGYVHSSYVELEKNEQNPNPPGGDQEEPKPPVDPVPPPSDKKKYAIVTASALNVRSGPSTKNHRVGIVVKGNKLTVLGQSGDWYKVEYKGITGYVSGKYIKLESTGTQPPSQPPSGGGNGSNNGGVIARGTVTATALNVRSGAGTGFSIIGSLKKNAQVEILQKAGSWYKIKYGSKTGYVSGKYIKLSSGSNNGSNNSGNNGAPPSRQEQNTKTGIVTASALNVRSGAGTKYSKIGYLRQNAKVTIIGQTGTWYKIKFGSGTGYVSNQYIKISNAPSSRGDDREQSSGTAVVTASWLNVRTGPGVNYTRIGAIKKNTKVTILGKSGSWYRIQHGALKGYVSGEYLKF